MEIDKKIEMGRLLEVYGDLLTNNQRDIASMYYDMDMSLKEISEQHGDISRQAGLLVFCRNGLSLSFYPLTSH